MNLKFENFNYDRYKSEQRHLFKESFPEIKNLPSGSAEHYDWKHRGQIKSFQFSAILDQKLIGYYAALSYKYKFNDNYIKAGMVCDVMTGKASRGRGVFTKLGKYSTKKLKNNSFDITTGFPIRKEVIPGHLKAGWETAFKLPLYFKINTSKSILKKIYLGPFSNVVDFFIKIISLPFNLSFQRKNVDVSKSNALNFFKSKRYNEINQLVSRENLIYLNKDSEFMNWRLSAPKAKYNFYEITYNKKLIGYVLTRDILKFGINCTGIVDIVFLKDKVKFLKYALSKIKFKGDLILLMCNKKLYNNYLLYKSGFIKSSFNFTLIIKDLSKNFSKDLLFSEKNWHLTWIDSDDL
jgi:hypothetical protein